MFATSSSYLGGYMHWLLLGVFQRQRDRPTESDPSRDGLTGKTVKACCIIQTHWQKLTQGQGCPRNHWDGRTNLHCVCYYLHIYVQTHTDTRGDHTVFTHTDTLIELNFSLNDCDNP